MRIDVNRPANLVPADWNKSQGAKGASGSIEGANSDRTTLSSAGSTVQTLTAQALKMPEVRQDRVDALRHSISNGTYPLDAARTAAAIVASGEQ